MRDCFGAENVSHNGIMDSTYIIAPREDRAPLCGNAGSRRAVDARPGLVGVD